MKKLVRAVIVFILVSIGLSVFNSIKKGESPVEGLKSTIQNETKVITSSYEDIYKEYSEKMTKQYQTSEKKLKKAVSDGKNMDQLAEICAEETEKLAEISVNGTEIMADICTKKHASTSDYMDWSSKLNSEYMAYGMQLNSIYMSGATSSFQKELQEQLKGLKY